MARTTAELLAQLERFLPPRYSAYRPVLAGVAAALQAAEAAGAGLAEAVTVEGATGAFLTLLARGYGVTPATGESEDSIRYRLRNAEEQVTRDAILTAVNALLAEFTVDEATILEPWDEGFADVDAWSDSTILADQPLSFVLVCPLVGDEELGGTYADIDYLDGDAWAGDGTQHPVYAAIVVLVERLRAAGISWWLHIDS
ncbi:MAG: hypothetical protein L0221_15845 [Chloroflexi bacterium]|nr:hypothetical protein [Chloroflexota bacterium]